MTDAKCLKDSCNIKALYNLPSEHVGLYCKKHKLQNMINVINKCKIKNCTKLPYWNLPSEIKGIYCKDHKQDNMINIKGNYCSFENCYNRPIYNDVEAEKPEFCIEHKQKDMVNFNSFIKCKGIHCFNRPYYNLPNEKKPLFCIKHKTNGMINFKSSSKCIVKDCNKAPIYNLSSEKIPKYCNIHKTNKMIIFYSNICINDNCIKHALYNNKAELKPLYCSLHKQKNMINVISTKCIQENCINQPVYNLLGQTKPLYCSQHKADDMINVRTKINYCNQTDCKKYASYNYHIELKPKFCLEHKLDNMINFKSKFCQSSKCKNTPIFGMPNKKPHYCITHKQPNMINLVLENKCSVLDCDEEYYLLVDTIKYCNKHIPDSSLTSIKRLCKYCDIKEESTFVCKDCKKIQNKKEWAIVRYLRKNIKTNFEYNSSKMLQGCSKKRPDIFFDLPKHCIIVEIDEHQHINYGDSCECARINEIVNGIGGKSVIIIRYNPDVVKHNNKILDINQSDRIDTLITTINQQLMKDYDQFIVKIIQLYYNDNYPEYQIIKEENVTDKVAV